MVCLSVSKGGNFHAAVRQDQKFSVEQAIDYLNRNPVKNLPKLLD